MISYTKKYHCRNGATILVKWLSGNFFCHPAVIEQWTLHLKIIGRQCNWNCSGVEKAGKLSMVYFWVKNNSSTPSSLMSSSSSAPWSCSSHRRQWNSSRWWWGSWAPHAVTMLLIRRASSLCSLHSRYIFIYYVQCACRDYICIIYIILFIIYHCPTRSHHAAHKVCFAAWYPIVWYDAEIAVIWCTN